MDGMISVSPAVLSAVVALSIGLLSIGVGLILKVFKGPVETQGEFSLELRAQRQDHTELAENVAVLSNEVKHLAENVKALGEEVKQIWRVPKR